MQLLTACKSRILTSLLLLAPIGSHAHSGHGADVPHFHADELSLVIVLISVLGIVSAFIGRK